MAERYERDFYAWAKEQAEHLKAGRVEDLDFIHLAEEVESMDISERREISKSPPSLVIACAQVGASAVAPLSRLEGRHYGAADRD
jgi:hypothetical protein